MIHQPSGGAHCHATEINNHAQEILKIRERINEILAKHTGKSVKQVAQDTERDNFMSAEESKKYGLVDEVFSKRPSPANDK